MPTLPFAAWRRRQSAGRNGSAAPTRAALERSAFTLILLGLAALAFVPGAPLAALFCAALLMIPAAIVSRQPQPPLYSRAWNLATILLLALGFFFTEWTVEGSLRTLSYLCAFLQIGKGFNYRQRRDYLHLWLLTLMMFLLAPLATPTPPPLYALALLAFLAVSVRHLGAFAWMPPALPGAMDESGGADAPASAPESAARPPFAPLFASCLVLTFAVFLALPRPLAPGPSLNLRAERADRDRKLLSTGFSDQLDLEQLSQLRPNPAVALRLTGGPAVRNESLRLRATAFDCFDGYRWRRSPFDSAAIPLHRAAAANSIRLAERAGAAGDSPGALDRIQIFNLDFPFPILLTLPGCVGIENLGGDAFLTPGDSIVAQGRVAPRAYTLVYERVNERAREPRDIESPGFHLRPPAPEALRVPPALDSEELRDMAEEITGGASIPLEKACRIEAWFQRHGRYTLQLDRFENLTGPEALRTFLASSRPTGHCELFATAMALLAREAGLPARVATGFLGGEFQPEENALLVRFLNAHAWVEVWIEGRGWMTFDPTPAAPMVNLTGRVPFLRLQQALDRISGAWEGATRQYGGEIQRRALAWLGERAESALAALSPGGDPGGFAALLRQSLSDPLFQKVALAALLINLAALWAQWRIRRASIARNTRRATTGGRLAGGNPVLWARARRALLRALGAPPPPAGARGISFAEYVARQARAAGAGEAAWRRALEFYERRRFGSGAWSAGDEHEFRALLRALRRPAGA